MANQQIYKQKELLCFKVICFSEIINQNNVQPLIQDFAFEIFSHILYPIIKSLQFLKDPNLLKWPINSDCEFHHLSWIGTAFPDLCLPFTARSKASLQVTFEGFRVLTTWILQLWVKSTTPNPAPVTQRPRSHDVIHPQVSAQLFPACPWPCMSLNQPYSTSMLQIKNNPSGKHSLVPKSRLDPPFYTLSVSFILFPLFVQLLYFPLKSQLLSFLCTRVLGQLEGKSKSFEPLYISGA